MSVVDHFEPTMQGLDALIKKLETNLGKAPQPNPFDDLRANYGPNAKPKEEVKKEEPKKEEKKQEEKKDQPKKEKKEKKEKKAAAPVSNLTPELEWFNACDLRVGKIVECEICPNSEKLYIEKIDLGEG